MAITSGHHDRSAQPLKIRLQGFPIAYSAAPLFQNACFEVDDYAWRYELFSTSQVTPDILAFLKSEECAGAAFTMPLKAAIIPHLDEITPESRLTGAVNTVVRVQTAEGLKLVGTNTDFLGIHSTLSKAMTRSTVSQNYAGPSGSFDVDQTPPRSAVVIGGGATTRSAILALYTLSVRHICIINRDSEEVQSTMAWFEQAGLCKQGLQFRHLASVEDVEAVYGVTDSWPALSLGVGAVPSILPKTADERRVYSTAAHLLSYGSSPSSSVPSTSFSGHSDASPNDKLSKTRPIFLDMAYHPRETHLLKLAGALGWETISGDQAMMEQGFAQQRMWRLGDASADAGSREGVLSEKAMLAAAKAVREAGDIGPQGVEVDRAAGRRA